MRPFPFFFFISQRSMENQPATVALQALLESISTPKERAERTSFCLVDFPRIEWHFDDVSREHMELLRSETNLIRSLPIESVVLQDHPTLVASAYTLYKNSAAVNSSALLHLLRDQLRVSSKFKLGEKPDSVSTHDELWRGKVTRLSDTK
jgi:hypothetical protein